MQMNAALSRATDRVYQAAGVAAAFSGADADGACTVLVEQDLSRYGDTAKISAKTAVLSVRVAELAEAPRRGDTFVMSDDLTYTVDSLLSTDTLEHKVFVS